MFMQTMESPLGKLGIRIEEDRIVSLEFINKPEQNSTPSMKPELAQTAHQALSTYFKQPDYQFNLSLQPQGTPFQQKVWRALCEIPSGTTLTYGQLAKKLQTSPRAIGQACRKNPIPIIIPCHRVTGANHVGGFMGETKGDAVQIKNWLLAHEKSMVM